MKKLIVFDLDGTLAESKSSLDAEMATLLRLRNWVYRCIYPRRRELNSSARLTMTRRTRLGR